MILDYYKILQINPDANIETIKKAYRRRALECHPDRGGSHEQMVLINEAWGILSNPITRASYDAASLNVENKEYVHKAETESRNAREQAEQYPRDWNEFETWMDKVTNAVISDFKKAEYGETFDGKLPTAGKSFTGWIFIVVGGVIGYVLSAFILSEFNIRSTLGVRFIAWPLIGVGALCGRIYHETIKEKLGTQKPFSHSKPNEKSHSSFSEIRETARDGRFIAYNNGTVLDTRTNLMWASKDNGRDIKWENAKSYCKNYRGGGYSDWRMPTQDELAGLYDVTKAYKPEPNCLYDIHLTELIRLSFPWEWASETRGSEVAYFCLILGKRYWRPQSDWVICPRSLPVRSDK